jgi:hypothetical protein
MSETRSNSKRKRQEEHNDGESSSDGGTDTVFRGWLDEGVPRPDGTIDHDSFSISLGEDIVDINLGDSVLMRSPNQESFDYTNDPIDYYGSSPSKSGNKMMIARVERIWEERRSQNPSRDSTYKFRARWFLSVCDGC